MNLFIILGNPPAVHFYQEWGKEMEVDSFYVSSYPLLPLTKNSEQFMRDVSLSHLAQFDEYYKVSNTKVTIIAHSLGSYFALKLLSERTEQIEKVILLFPFLRMPNAKGRLILKIVSSLHSRKALQQAIIKHRKLLEIFSDELTYLTNDEIQKTFYIAKHERAVIALDSSFLELDEKYRSKIEVYYNHKDTWCSYKVISDLKSQKINCKEVQEPHGFITDKVLRKNLLKQLKIL